MTQSKTPIIAQRQDRCFRVGLVVAFAALDDKEMRSVMMAWECAANMAAHWTPAFSAIGLTPLPENPQGVDILVYLGESSRFNTVAERAARTIPVVFVKSTVEELMLRPKGSARRYRMSTGVDGIAHALAYSAPQGPTVDWVTLPWPNPLAGHIQLDEAEQGYVENSLAAFRKAAETNGNPWIQGLPPKGPFSVFLTMHDPLAAKLAQAALQMWPDCTPIAADGMSSTQTPEGNAWPDRLMRVRHWTSHSRSTSNLIFRNASQGQSLPDIDLPGMLYGTLVYLEHAFAAGAQPENLEVAGKQPGPLGLVNMTPSGRSNPERVIVFQGRKWKVVSIPQN